MGFVSATVGTIFTKVLQQQSRQYRDKNEKAKTKKQKIYAISLQSQLNPIFIVQLTISKSRKGNNNKNNGFSLIEYTYNRGVKHTARGGSIWPAG